MLGSGCASSPLTTSIVLAIATPTATNIASVLVQPNAWPPAYITKITRLSSTVTVTSVGRPTRAIVRTLNSRPIVKNNKITPRSDSVSISATFSTAPVMCGPITNPATM